MKFEAALGGLLQGLKIGVVQSLDTMSDEHVIKALHTAVVQVTEKTQLPKLRQKRLLQLLKLAVEKAHEEMPA